MSGAARGVHDLAADRRAALLGELFASSSSSAHLQGNATLAGALTPELLLQHVTGRERIGAIPFVSDTEVGWGCIDLDVGPPNVDEPETLEMVSAIVETLALDGIRGITERSRSKGWHVWVFLDRPASAADIRAYLRRAALNAGAHDAADLVCPRQDTRGDMGNGTYLPLFGNACPANWPHEWDEAGDLLPVEPERLATFLRGVIDEPSPASAIPQAEPALDRPDGPEDHACAWIIDELADEGIALEGLIFLGGPKPEHERLNFRCPFHRAPQPRARGGSAVMWADGRGRCSSAKCERTWRTLRAFVELLQDEQRVDPLVARFERVSIAYTFEGPPPARRFLLRDFAPEDETGLFVALGGAGKGHAQVALARSLALGEAFGRFEPPRPRGVLLVSMEEDPAELHRRLWASLRLGTSDEDFRARLEELRPALTARLGFVSLRGLAGVTFETVREPLVRAAERIEDLGLVALDPIGRFVPPGCEINSQEGAATIVGALDRLREELQALTVGVYHVSKLAHRTGAELAAGASSGSQQLEDLARWVLNGRSLKPEDAQRYGLDPHGRYLELALAKSNYTATLGEPLVFSRGPGGALDYVRASRPEVADEEAALAALNKLGHWATREAWEEAADEAVGLSRERCRSARARLVKGGGVEQHEVREGRRFKLYFAPRGRSSEWPEAPEGLNT